MIKNQMAYNARLLMRFHSVLPQSLSKIRLLLFITSFDKVQFSHVLIPGQGVLKLRGETGVRKKLFDHS